jgi:transcriptional regulator with XRE-family HTH domain
VSEAEDKADRAKTAYLDKAIGQRLRDQREAMGLKRHDVAAALAVSVSRIQHYEGGERIPASRLWQFCGHYGIAVGALFEGLPHHVGPDAPTQPVSARLVQGGVEDASAPFEVDTETHAFQAAIAGLNPVERRVMLAALRGVGINRLKRP